jgi:hypothetical protein
MSVDAFLSLSAHLTGFRQVELVATGMVKHYYEFLVANVENEDLLRIWAIAARLDKLEASNNHVSLKAEILCMLTDQRLGPIAKNITRVWYTGAWRKDPSDASSRMFVSAQAYQESLQWKVAHTHPPGAKQPGFGSWSELPL